ncbi:MAG: hypothetical protein EBX53_06950 [Betaproteobacteria bacterium]|nr:hypothetical protein [Betaproteobacteria bacterium]
MRTRLGRKLSLQLLKYGERLKLGEIELSLHPAGHVLGSSQVRLSHKGNVWVISGDYRVQADASCEAFEPVLCDVFVTESTFALPIYRW